MSGPNWSRRRALAATGAGIASLAGCISGDPDDGDDGDDATVTPESTPESDFTPPTPDPDFAPDPDWEPPTDVPASDVEANVLVENLEIPWDIALADNGDLFVTERTGRINQFSTGDIEAVLAPGDAIDAEAVDPGADESPWWVDGGEGGTMGIETHPDYPDTPYIYVCYTATEGVNRLSRFDVSADDPGRTEEIIIGDIPGHRVHNGGRIEFGPDGYLWVGTGSAAFDEEEESSQVRDLSSLAGKVLRVDADGEPAPDNPEFGGDADPRIYSYAHRNVQGIVWPTPETPIVTEHGPTARDEINRLVPGGHYGWDYYDDAVRSIPEDDEHETYVDHDDVFPPLVNTGPGTTWAPSGATFYTGDDVPSWQHRMIVGGLVSQTVYVLTLTPPGADLPPADGGTRYDADWLDHAYTVTAHPVLEDQLGRVRHLAQGNDGELYAITSNRDGRADGPFPTESDDVLVRIEQN